MSRLPVIKAKHRICIICEGFEEQIYMERLLSFNLWSPEYEFVLVNAKGESNIFARYQDAYNKDYYEVIIIFCDTDRKPYKEYTLLMKKLDDFFGILSVARSFTLWANPCSMQIILSHFDKVCLSKQGKRINSGIIEELTGVKGYNGHESQINEICQHIFRRTYSEMKERIRAEQYDHTKEGTTNAVHFFELFEQDDVKWIAEINRNLEG